MPGLLHLILRLQSSAQFLTDFRGSRPGWDPLLESISTVVEAAEIPECAKAAIKENVRSSANSAAKRDQLQALGDSIGIEIGADEHAAWKRRNKAAHGVPIAEGKELETIRDMKPLMVLFHRMLLAITGAADFYLDYASEGVPIRPLKEPPLSVVTPGNRSS
jgi:hypothetical protein